LADETLVLAAQVYDQFSAPIRSMQAQLRQLAAENAKSHTQGVALAKAHGESFTRLRESVSKTSEVFRREFAPMLKDIASEATGLRFALTGIGGAAAAAVGGAASMAFSFAGTARSLRDLSQSTGMSVNDLRVLEQIGPRIGSSVEAMDGGFQSLNAHMERLRRFPSAEIADMQKTMFPAVASQVAGLANLPRPVQFERILDIVERIKQNPGRGGGEPQARNVLRYFGLPEQLAEYSDRVRDVVAQIRQNLKPLSADQIMMGLEASVAWSNLQLRMKGFSDYIGATFAPVLTRAMDGIAAEFTTLESSATGWLDKIKADPSVARDWDDLSKRVGNDIKSLIGSLGNFDDMSARPRVLPLSVAPQWVGFGQDLKNLITDADNVAKIVDDLNAKKVNWTEVLNLADLTDRIASFKAATQPIIDWSDKMARLKWWLPGNQYEPPPDPKNPEGPTSPSILDRLRSWFTGRSTGGPGRSPSGPTSAPLVLPKLGGMDDFSKPATAPLLPQFAHGYSPIAFHPENGLPNPLLKGSTGGASSSTSDAINIIAVGVRKGTFDALTDYAQSVKALAGRAGAGVTPASYEIGAGGPGGGAGGGGAGGRPGAPGSPAGKIGHAVRHGRGTGGGGGATESPELPPGAGGPLLNEIAKSEGTGNNYNDSYAHANKSDLSKLTFDQTMALSKTLGQQHGSSAIGRYQFMHDTLAGLKSKLGLSGNEMFTPALQDRLGKVLLQGRGYDEWKTGKLSDQAFMHNLSKEWAGLTDPNTGRGYYPGQTTGHSLAQQFAALKAELDKQTRSATAGASDPPVLPGHLTGKSDPINPSFSPSWQKGLFREGIFTPGGFQGPHNRPVPVERPLLPGQQDASLRRREPGALLKAADARQAAALKHTVSGEASLKIALSSGLKPVGGVKSSGDLFKKIQLDRASPLPLANTTG
jgi:muramidase (phage lysozyme)